jgi:hypothetical protein
MLARGGELPTGEGWGVRGKLPPRGRGDGDVRGDADRPRGAAAEVKWDGFRAIVSTEDDLRVRSRRGWDIGALGRRSRS